MTTTRSTTLTRDEIKYSLTDRFEDRIWLLKFLGPQQMAELEGPISEATAAAIAKKLDEIEQELPVHAAIMKASDAELPAVVERILAESDQ